MAGGSGHQNALHRPREPLAERVCGELPRQVPPRVPGPGDLLHAEREPGGDRRLARKIQPREAAPESRHGNAERVRGQGAGAEGTAGRTRARLFLRCGLTAFTPEEPCQTRADGYN